MRIQQAFINTREKRGHHFRTFSTWRRRVHLHSRSLAAKKKGRGAHSQMHDSVLHSLSSDTRKVYYLLRSHTLLTFYRTSSPSGAIYSHELTCSAAKSKHDHTQVSAARQLRLDRMSEHEHIKLKYKADHPPLASLPRKN